MSIHTCLPGMECMARPPGSETRAWRTEGMIIIYRRERQSPVVLVFIKCCTRVLAKHLALNVTRTPDPDFYASFSSSDPNHHVIFLVPNFHVIATKAIPVSCSRGCVLTCEPGAMRRWCPPMPGLLVPMLRPGGKARPRGGKDGYGGRAGGGMGHGSVESESWHMTQKGQGNVGGCVNHL